VGDVVRSGEFIGVVERVGWRAARIRTFANHIVVLPNSLISRERIEVFPQNASNANLISVGVAYSADPSTVIDVLQRAVQKASGVSSKFAPVARIKSFDDSAVTYEVKYWTETYHLRDTIDAELITAISAELQEVSGQPVFPVSSAAGTGLEPVLDALLGYVGEEQAAELEDGDDMAEAKPWSPL
jgi:small-conductance mechanosensitive channel